MVPSLDASLLALSCKLAVSCLRAQDVLLVGLVAASWSVIGLLGWGAWNLVGVLAGG